LNKIRSILFTLALIGAVSFGTTTSALASTSPPVTAPKSSGMVDRPGAGTASNSVAVRTIAQAGNNVWVGGAFDEVDDTLGQKVADASDLAVFDATTGLLVPDVHLPLVTRSNGMAEVYDSSVGPDGALYFAGKFDAVDGIARHGVAAIDPATGALLPFAPDVGAAHTILATADSVYVGTTKLLSFRLDGTATPGYTPPEVFTAPALRSEMTTPAFRDVAKRGHVLVAACQCDQLVDAQGTRKVKAVVEIDAATGDWVNWVPANLPHRSQASGLSLILHDFPGTTDPTVYLAAGGNDFTAAFDFATGAQRWREDTSGSSQAITWYGGFLIVGGHFDWTQMPGGPTCGSNPHPNPACYFTPRLVAMDASTGSVMLDTGGIPWNPGICCRYNGVWALLTGSDRSTLNVGGEFTEVGGSWTCEQAESACLSGAVTQKYFARFAGLTPASQR
jgi:hypothetical protein